MKTFLYCLLLFIFALVGCSSKEPPKQFNDLIKGEVVKISSRSAGNGDTFSITDKEEINQFLRTMNSTTYTRVEDTQVKMGVGSGGGYGLFGKGNTPIATIQFAKENVVEINKSYYKMNRDIKAELEPFFNEFWNDKNNEKKR